MVNVITCMAYFYVYIMYAAHFSIMADCDNFVDGWLRAWAYLLRPRGLFLTAVIGGPMYVLAHVAVWLSVLLGLFWLVVWGLHMRKFVDAPDCSSTASFAPARSEREDCRERGRRVASIDKA